MITPITKYRTTDGTEFPTEQGAERHEALCQAIAEVMRPLGASRELRADDYVQHDPAAVIKARVGILALAAERADYPIFRHQPPEEVHPNSAAGRILDDVGGPLRDAWFRFRCTDEFGREWQQPYFAINTPAKPNRMK